MAKKNVDAVVVEDVIEEVGIEEDVVPADGALADGAFKFDTDFDIEEEYKIPPLVPAAKYEAYVTNVKFDAAANALVWSLALKADDDVTMSDNELLSTVLHWSTKTGSRKQEMNLREPRLAR